MLSKASDELVWYVHKRHLRPYLTFWRVKTGLIEKVKFLETKGYSQFGTMYRIEK